MSFPKISAENVHSRYPYKQFLPKTQDSVMKPSSNYAIFIGYPLYSYGMGVGTGRHRGHVPPPPPPLILPSEIFLTQYALLSRKLAHTIFIFNKIFRLASLANQDNLTIYNFKQINYFTSLILKVHVFVHNIQKACNQLFNIQLPSMIYFKIISAFRIFIQVPKSQEKKLSCRHNFPSKLVQDITILLIF